MRGRQERRGEKGLRHVPCAGSGGREEQGAGDIPVAERKKNEREDSVYSVRQTKEREGGPGCRYTDLLSERPVGICLYAAVRRSGSDGREWILSQ